MWYYPDLVAKAKRSSLGAIVIGILFPVLRVVCFGLYCLRLRRLFRELKPDQLVVVNGGHPGGDTCRAAILSWNGMKKPIYSFHNLSKKARPREQFIEDQLDQALLRAAGPLVSVSKACASSLANRPALTTAPVRVIYNGINAPDDTGENSVTPLRQTLGRSNDTRICLMLATYEPRKGHEFVLRAFQNVLRSVPDVCLVICGAGTADEIKVVTTIINLLHLTGHVHLENYREDAMTLLRQADLLVVPSQAFESFGLTIVEAMARGIPVVATDVGGIPEVLKNEEGGFCIAQNDVTGFAAAMIHLLNDTQLASMQAARGIRRYHENFEAEHMTEAYVALVHDN